MMLLALYAVIVEVGFPLLNQTRPTPLVARYIQRVAPADAPVGLYRLEHWRASVRYYVARPVARLDSIDDLATFLRTPQPVYIVMRRVDYLALREAKLPIQSIFLSPAVMGTTGRGLRRQRWGYLVIATNAPVATTARR